MANGQEIIGAQALGLAGQSPTLTERLESEKESLVERLQQIDGVLNGLKKHPETAAILDAVAKLGHMPY